MDTPQEIPPIDPATELQAVFDQIVSAAERLAALPLPTAEALAVNMEIVRRLFVTTHLLVRTAAEAGVAFDRRPYGDLPALLTHVPGLRQVATQVVSAREALEVQPAEVAAWLDALLAIALAENRDSGASIALEMRKALQTAAEQRAGVVFGRAKPPADQAPANRSH